MKTLLLISLIFLTSCNFPLKKRKVVKHFYSTSNPVFDEYVSDFIDDCQDLTDRDCNVTTIINFTDGLDNRTLARCYEWHGMGTYDEILVNASRWETLNEMQRKEVIYHELGHAELNRGHKDDLYAIGGHEIPLSIMNTYHIGIRNEELFDAYNKELFNYDDSEIISYYNEKYSCDFCSSVLQ